jgi:hypothetical protein
MSASRDGLQRKCKRCASAAFKEWRETNRDYDRARTAAWDSANRERRAARSKEHRTVNKVKRSEQYRAWVVQNRDLRARSESKRRARKHATVPQRWRVHDIIPFVCYWCGTNLRAYGATEHVDHVMPISLGGPVESSNEVMACAACNQSKAGKHPLVWIASLVE